MKFEPQTFFIGILDFFSILLPGAVIVALLLDPASTRLLSIFPNDDSNVTKWAIFLFASYLAGHFIFLLGSQVDSIYGKIHDATKAPADPTKKRSKPIKWLDQLLFKKSDLAIDQVEKLQKKCIPDVDREVINAFQWAKARLLIQCPAAFLDVQRLEADSKFFRSFFVVLLVLVVWLSALASRGTPGYRLLALGCVVLAGLSFWRYAERRSKSIEQVCWYLITLEYCQPPKTTTKAA